MNDAAKIFNHADYCFTLDTVHLAERYDLPDFKGQKVAAVPEFYGTELATHQIDRILPRRDTLYVRRVLWSEQEDYEVIRSGCSGYGAYELAYKSGAKEIFLFGCDHTKMGEYFYGTEEKRGQVLANWERAHREWNAASLPVKAYNVSPESTIESIPKIDWRVFCILEKVHPSPIVTVLKTGGEYNEEHVFFIYKQLLKHNLGHYLVVLTDHPQAHMWPMHTLPLKHDFPGWWSKMEMFDPSNYLGDFLYMDLDTVIVKDIAPFLYLEETTVLRDFYSPQRNIGSGLMYIMREDAKPVWDAFIKDPKAAMEEKGPSIGDQNFINKFFNQKRSFDGDLVQSYKVDFISKKRDLDKAAIMCFHGQPRPWNLTDAQLRGGLNDQSIDNPSRLFAR